MQKRRKFYHPTMTRKGLLYPKGEETPWKRLYLSGDRDSMVTATGFDIIVFNELLALFEPVYHSSSPYDYALSAQSGRRYFDAAACLGLTLQFLRSQSEQHLLSQVFGGTPSVISTYLSFGLNILHHNVLPNISDCRIAWPNKEKLKEYANLVHAYEPNLPYGAVGFVDGLNLLIFNPLDPDTQNAYYNGWLADTYCSNIFVFAPDGRIIYQVLNAPGSWHDARIARLGGYFKYLDRHCPDPFYFVADSAFPRPAACGGKIMRPRKHGELSNHADNDLENALDLVTDSACVRVRQAAEWGMRALQSAFPRTKSCLTSDHAKRGMILSTCAGQLVFKNHLRFLHYNVLDSIGPLNVLWNSGVPSWFL